MGVAAVPFFEQASEFVLRTRPDFTTLEATLSSSSRLFLWQRSLELMADHIFWGIGPGMFPTLDISYPGAPSILLWTAHNVFLDIGVETGVAGLAAFLAIVLIVGRHTIRLLGSLDTSSYKRSLRLIAFSLVGFLIVAVTTGVPLLGGQGLAGALIPWALAGLLMGAGESGTKSAHGVIPEPDKQMASQIDA